MSYFEQMELDGDGGVENGCCRLYCNRVKQPAISCIDTQARTCQRLRHILVFLLASMWWTLSYLLLRVEKGT